MTKTTEEWSEWFNHDGKGCPVPVGTICMVTLRDGATYQTKVGYGIDGINSGRPHGMENSSLSRWISSGRAIDIIRYRIRIPRALIELRRIAENPAPVPEKETA